MSEGYLYDPATVRGQVDRASGNLRDGNLKDAIRHTIEAVIKLDMQTDARLTALEQAREPSASVQVRYTKAERHKPMPYPLDDEPAADPQECEHRREVDHFSKRGIKWCADCGALYLVEFPSFGWHLPATARRTGGDADAG